MRRLTGDRGAVSVLTAVIGSVVLFACAAIAIDVGALYSERRQLQNGADAAAVAIAQSCVRTLGTSSPRCDTSTAPALANGNAVDGAARVALVCGTAPGLGTCPLPTGSGASCDPLPAGAPPYVEVHTRTRNADGSGAVDPIFARTIPGNEDYAGTTVGACARAGYGSPTTVLSVLPITVSQCVVDQYRAQRGGFAPMSLLDSLLSSLLSWQTGIELHTDSGPCSTSSSGQKAPGNFGYLDSDGSCSVTTTVGETLPGDPGNSNPTTLGCTDAYLSSLLDEVVYVPVFDTVTGTGSKVQYHIVGYAAFHFTGWQLAGTSHPSIVTGLLPCAKPTTCIGGAFLHGLQPTPGPISPAPDYGATVVQLLG
ncbi:pilus assembly protein TadG-related protein [Pseudonocardia bannensis]|uniref:Putative Flp pilus-assembly TadG-like N-terminal domain-containing protein n=1 Tax=Pseudonocardia bannensis TaxID=630973 RepID=A0A848DNU4_9PSEU|nr:pilus assembly protein TadG-related protein [Pseudonocardia bannensis]NMH94091.1 hypothetical protein [Pseudonocardia bannensis]